MLVQFLLILGQTSPSEESCAQKILKKYLATLLAFLTISTEAGVIDVSQDETDLGEIDVYHKALTIAELKSHPGKLQRRSKRRSFATGQ